MLVLPVATAILLSSIASAKQGGAVLQPKLDQSVNQCPSPEAPGPIQLRGGAEVHQYFNRDIVNWQATQYYKQGAACMAYGDYNNAATFFKISADGFAMTGEGKFQAQCRYAEGQMRRLLRQEPQAVALFKLAADLFKQYDPYNPYLKASLDLSQQKESKPLAGKVTKSEAKPKLALIALPAMADSVSHNIVLKGKATTLANGTDLTALKDEAVFNAGKGVLAPMASGVSDNFIKGAITKAFMKMTCLEMAALGGNYYTAPDLYKGFKANGKTVVIGVADEVDTPVLKLTLNGHEYGVLMDLPEVANGTRIVLPITDGEHVLAIDVKTGDTWKLQATPAAKAPDFNWWKLTHIKKKT